MPSRAVGCSLCALILTAALSACDSTPATRDARPPGKGGVDATDARGADAAPRDGSAVARRDGRIVDDVTAADRALTPAIPPIAVLGAAEDPGNVVCSAVAPPATMPCAEHDEAWLATVYGVVVVRAEPSAATAYRLVEIIEREGPVAIETWVVDEAAAPLPGAAVVFCYPVAGVPTAPACDANLVPVPSDGQGKADFVMTGSGYIACGQPGPFAAWIDDPGVPSDRVYGLGMLVNTNHRHVNLLFQRVAAGTTPTSAIRCPL